MSSIEPKTLRAIEIIEVNKKIESEIKTNEATTKKYLDLLVKKGCFLPNSAFHK